MKVFATLATVLGASVAAPPNQLRSSNGMRMNQQSMQPSVGMSMNSQMSRLDNSDRPMDMNHQMSNIRGIYMNNQDMASNMMNPNMLGQDMSRNMMGQEMRSNMVNHNMLGQDMVHNMIGQDMGSTMRDMHRQNQVVMPNQYIKKDNMGNYVFAYDDQLTKRKEEGNNHGGVKGQYTYTMPNGLQRQVEFVADNNGFHVRDNADPARIKRSSEPDLVQTKMTSVMDSSLRDDGRDMLRMSNMMGTERDINMMGMDQQRYSNIMMGRNMMGQDSMGRNMMGQETMGRNLMEQHNMRQGNMGQNMVGRNIYNIMSNRGMTADMSKIMGQQMESNMMGQGKTMDVMGRNMMGQDKVSPMISRNMMNQQNMTPNMMYSNMMGQAMLGMTNNQMSSNMIDSNDRLMGQHMMQQMERIPETYTSTRMF